MKTCQYTGLHNRDCKCDHEVFEDDKCIFHCEKTEKNGWFILHVSGKKQWNNDLVKDFWEKIREYVKSCEKNENITFDSFIFPKFESEEGDTGINFFLTNEKKEYNDDFKSDKKFSFNNVTFLGGVYFNNVTFNKKISFDGATFESTSYFLGTTFNDQARFNWTKFKGSVYFDNLKGNGYLNFNRTIFHQNNSSHFIFDQNDNTNERKLGGGFQYINFPESTLFKNCDLSQTSFLNSNIEQVKFEECNFWEEGVKKDERKIFDERTLKETDINQNYERVESVYRQLKYNFDQKSNYQKADDFYGGEMEMRLRQQGGWYYFYKYLSNYNNSISRIVLWILGTILAFTAWYGLHIHSFLFSVGIAFLLCTFFIYIFWKNTYKQLFLYSCCFLGIGFSISAILFAIFHDLNNITFSLQKIVNYTISNYQISFIDSLEYSFTSTIPLLSSSEEITKNMDIGFKFIHYFQVIFSTILWALLILTFRRKFKRGGE